MYCLYIFHNILVVYVFFVPERLDFFLKMKLNFQNFVTFGNKKGCDNMPLPKEHFYTSDDYWNLPDGQRAELIDGQLYDMAPPSRIHQKLISQFTLILGEFIKNNHGSCEVYPAPFAVNLDANDQNWVEPDISVICDKDKLTDRGCTGAPDFIIEIVSPSSRRLDYNIKMALYSNAGVREYWIVDPAKERTTIYRFEDDAAPMIYQFNDEVQVGIYKNLHINISDLLK